jgi:glycine/D-amino acid oxidase-like deaminating enzyme
MVTAPHESRLSVAAEPRAPSNGLSLWHDTSTELAKTRPSLGGDTEADVAIVGAGYTGLWCAYYLSRNDPSLRIVVLERHFAGYGASGRNGGWCSAVFPIGPRKMAHYHGADGAAAMRKAMREAVDEVGRVADREAMDIDFAKGGMLTLLRGPAQLARGRDYVDEARRFGISEDELQLLSLDRTSRHVRVPRTAGALFTPDCAVLHPNRLVLGLADRVEQSGVGIYEDTTVTELSPQVVITNRGRVRTSVVVRATEAFTSSLPGYRRDLLPIYSLMLATEPLPDDTWDAIGLGTRESLTEHRHMRIYCQRTADGRLAIGGRGAPYHFGSAVRPTYERDPRIHKALRGALADLFPAARGASITHRWGGPLALPRDWHPSVGLDRRSGIAWGGGYVGDGVAAANLAGRTLADLITARDTELTRLPWVNRRSKRWEPEPLRWLAVNAGLRLTAAADRAEQRHGRPARRARALARYLGL